MPLKIELDPQTTLDYNHCNLIEERRKRLTENVNLDFALNYTFNKTNRTGIIG